ncbi:MAG: GAF domain-containing protein [Ideonella sp.]|nr:GAF domain-containing protein [Ideonella sp.]
MRQGAERLEALRRLMVLESAPERDYDEITRLVVETLDVPIAMVNLLDAQRDWFKSCVGFPLRESPAATSFCEAIFETADDLIVVPDTRLDARFASHPFVVGAPGVRFYTAARLAVDGQTVGTLCAYDLRPREIDPAQVARLQVLANAVVALLQRRVDRAAG